MDTNALVSLNQIVSSLQNEEENYAPSRKKRLLQLTIEAVQHLNIFHAPSYKVAYYTVDTINTVDVPDDFIDYYRIGIIVDGQIWTLTKNDNIPVINAVDCGEWAGDADNQVSVDLPYEWQYSFTGGHNLAYYRYDPELRRLIFSGNMMGQQIILEYISSGVSLSGNTWIRVEAAKVIKDYVFWMSIKRKPEVALNLKEQARRDYYDSLQEYTRFSNAFTVDELLDAIRGGRHQTIKG